MMLMNISYPPAQIYYMTEHYTPFETKFPVLDKLLEDYARQKFHFIIGGLNGLCAEDITITDDCGNIIKNVTWKPLQSYAVAEDSDVISSDGRLSINSSKSVFLCTEAEYYPYEYTLSLKLDSTNGWFYFGLSVSGAEDSVILGSGYEYNYKSVIFIVPEKSSNRISFWDVQSKREWVINRTDFEWGKVHSLQIKKTAAGNQFFLDKEPIADMGNDILPHSHPFYELSYVYDGSGVMQVNGEEYTCTENTFIITKPNEIHSFKGGENCRLICLSFFYDNSLGFFSQTFYNSSKVVRRIITQLDYELKQRPYCFEDVSYKYLMYLIITVLRTQKKLSISALEQTVSQISDKLCGPIDSKMLADNSGYSYHHLRHLFKQYAGLSLNQYVESVRVSRAMYLLRNTNKPVSEIAENNGFGSMPKFKRSFAKITDMQPCNYREREYSALSLFETADAAYEKSQKI